MNNCKFEPHLLDFFSGELTSDEQARLERHLEECDDCRMKLQEITSVQQALTEYRRPAPSPSLLRQYHGYLDERFRPKQRQLHLARPFGAFREWWQALDRPAWTVTRLAFILVIGLIIGRLALQPDEQRVARQSTVRAEVSPEDLQFVDNFLVSSEMLLLEILNAELGADADSSELLLNREMAQKILIQTFVVHQKALRMRNQRVLDFLSHFEILLYEIANAEDEHLTDVLDDLREIVRDRNMLDWSRNVRETHQLVGPEI